jgi:acetyl esterase/lipase
MSGERVIWGDRRIERCFDVTDPKWAHPAVKDMWVFQMGVFDELYDPTKTIEEKRALVGQINFDDIAVPDDGSCTTDEYDVPGCPEEPDVTAHAVLYRPKDLEDRHARVLFYCLGSGMLLADHKTVEFELRRVAVKYRCVVVTCDFRTSLMAPYPAAINDLHATYAWMCDNAEQLGIDPDRVVIFGTSSGAHMATVIPFRLKRYGLPCPRGVIANNPITDDRQVYPSSQLVLSNFDGVRLAECLRMWLGVNYGSGRIGPEALANKATVEDCVGYPPLFIHASEFDPDRDYNREFEGKVLAAHSFAEYHQWGGLAHADLGNPMEPEQIKKVTDAVIDYEFELCYENDLRRPWVSEG